MPRAANVDRLGQDKIGKLLWEMSSQTTLSLLVYAIYSITDTYFLSVGINGLAAAGASIISPILIGLGGVATTVGAGGASVVSRALGENNSEKASRAIASTFLVFWAAALLITVFGALFIEPIVYLLGATPSIAPYAIDYGRIIFLGALTSTGFSTIIRADGNIRFSTLVWIIPITANVVLCWLFIMVLHMGVAGAALATVLGGQGISAGMSMYFFFLRKNSSYQLKPAYFKPNWPLMGEILIVGFPSFIKSLSASLVVIITNNLLKTIGGDSALSIFAIVNRIYASLSTPKMGLVQGMQPIIGFNFGKKQFDRVRQTIRLALSISALYGLFICALSWLIPTVLIGLLTKESAIVEAGQSALRLLALAYPLGSVSVMVAAYFQAVGRPKEAFTLSIGSILLIKVPVLLTASSLFSLTGIWTAEAVSESALCLISILMLRSYQRKMSALQRADLAPAAMPIQPSAEGRTESPQG